MEVQGHSREKCHFFAKAPLISQILLWVELHSIAVICCVLNLTNSFKEDW